MTKLTLINLDASFLYYLSTLYGGYTTITVGSGGTGAGLALSNPNPSAYISVQGNQPVSIFCKTMNLLLHKFIREIESRIRIL